MGRVRSGEVSELFDELEEGGLTRNQLKVVVAAILGDMLEFFDYFLIGFVLSFIMVPWGLSYGESAVILLSSGVGAIVGGVFWGRLADRIGRRPVFISTILCFSLSTGVMYFTPEGGWLFLSFFRFLTGFGVGGLYSVDLPLVQEFVPTRYRGTISGIVTSFIPLGVLSGSLIAGYLTPVIGWRGLFLVGLLPATLTLLIRAWVPESPHWLMMKGRKREAAAALQWVLGKRRGFHAPDRSVDRTPEPAPPQSDEAGLKDLLLHPRSLIVSWSINLGIQTAVYGLTLWAPSLLALVLAVSPDVGARYYVVVALAGFAGRLFFSFGSDRFGRRPSGVALGVLGGIVLIAAGWNAQSFVGTVSIFWLGLIFANFFLDGGYAVVGPYSTEVWPKGLRATGMGSAYGFGGFGKILGPIVLAVFAGAENVVSPQATIDAVKPAFMFLGGLGIAAGLAFWFGVETRGKTFEEIDSMLKSKAVASGSSGYGAMNVAESKHAD